MFVGTDWAKDAHRVRVLCESSRIVRRFAVRHDRDGLRDLQRMLRAHGRADAIPNAIALAFLGRYPIPSDARRLGVKRMRAFLAKHAYSGRTKPETFIERMKAAPGGRQGSLQADAARHVILALVCTLRTLIQRIGEVTRALSHATRESAMGRLVMSFPAPATSTPPGSSRSSGRTSDATPGGTTSPA